jgi:hypothetical protein
VGGVIVITITVKNIYNTINIPNTAQKTANEIWNKTGLREHYEEIDTIGKELDEQYGR